MRNNVQKSVFNQAASVILRAARRFGRYRAMAFLSAALVMVAPALLTGCGAIQVRAGKKPDINVLQKSLQVGKSTQQDVHAALGNPHGQGRSMLPWQGSPRSVWSYYYEEDVIDLGGPNSDARRIFLFVFFDGDRFDGYMWFSSLKPSP